MNPEVIVKELTTKFDKKEDIYIHTINVEDYALAIPKEDCLRFIFYMVSLDSGMKSEVLYEGAKKLYETDKKWFSPDFVVNNSRDLAKVIKSFLQARYPNMAAKFWLENSKMIIDKYDNSFQKLFDADSATELLKRILEFKGYGNKKASLLVRTYINLFDKDYADMWELPMPIDRHKMRLTYEWGLISKKDYEKMKVEKVSNLWKSACKNAGIKWWQFDRAFWIYGAKKGSFLEKVN